MAEFEQLRDQLRQARNNVESAADAVIRAQERLKQISAQESALDRVFNARDQQHIAERHRLQEEKARAQAELTRQRDARGTALAGEADILKDFVRFTDPREGIVKLDDATPILLMPVRLETRFKTINAPGAPAPLRQLWVRIYPDDCWIDSFDPALTETEVANAKTYWRDRKSVV